MNVNRLHYMVCLVSLIVIIYVEWNFKIFSLYIAAPTLQKTIIIKNEENTEKEKKLIVNVKNQLVEGITNRDPNLSQIESLRRSIYEDILDLKLFVSDRVKKLKNELKNQTYTVGNLEFLENEIKQRSSIILANTIDMSSNEEIVEWKRRETDDLAQWVQKRIETIQNPVDCATSKKVVCKIKSFCGFGCQLHELVYCFVTAFFTNRTLLIDSKGWIYNPKGMEQYFLPVSKCPIDFQIPENTGENPLKLTDQVINLKMLTHVKHKHFPYWPPNIPKEISARLKNIHGNPLSWWIGQLAYYLLRFNDNFKKVVDQYENSISENTNNPIVGIHVRRTDKTSEALLYSVEEYMAAAEQYFNYRNHISANNQRRVVYLVTDDPNVIDEFTSKYPNYVFKSNRNSSMFGSVKMRYDSTSFRNLIFDLHVLSKCEYLVGTFSSNIGRLAYELMQVKEVDAWWRFHSLDSVYFFAENNQPYKQALLDHTPSSSSSTNNKNKYEREIELKKGDLIEYYPESGFHRVNLWNGFSFGKNKRTGQEGIFPTYKVKELILEF